MPSLGTVDALQPIAAAPVNMRDEVCGKHRKRPASEEEDDEEGTQASNSDVDQSSAFAMTTNSLREPHGARADSRTACRRPCRSRCMSVRRAAMAGPD